MYSFSGVKEKQCQKSIKLYITCFTLKYQNTLGTISTLGKKISTSSLSNHLYRSHVNKGITSHFLIIVKLCLAGRTL